MNGFPIVFGKFVVFSDKISSVETYSTAGVKIVFSVGARSYEYCTPNKTIADFMRAYHDALDEHRMVADGSVGGRL